MDDSLDNANVIITGHILIRDSDTGEILVNKSESSIISSNEKTQNKNGEKNAR